MRTIYIGRNSNFQRQVIYVMAERLAHVLAGCKVMVNQGRSGNVTLWRKLKSQYKTFISTKSV